MQAYFWAGESCLFIVEFTRSPSLILSPWKTWESSYSSHWGRGLGEIEEWCWGGGGEGGWGIEKNLLAQLFDILLQFYMALTSAEIFAHPKKTPVM